MHQYKQLRTNHNVERNKKALVIGILGQDGSYMAELLYGKGYDVHGIVKDNTDANRIEWLTGLLPGIGISRINILDKSELLTFVAAYHPHEIYNFASSTNVFSAWEDLDRVMDLDARVPQHILECILKVDKSIKFFQASSCLIFGRNNDGIQNESTPVNPIHPYGIAKAYADNMVREFRTTYNVFACSGIFFNHESPRRGDNFFSKKITMAAAKIKQGLQQTIKVGNLNSYRDYGYAPDYVEAAYLMMQNSEPTDYVIGTGKLITMMDFAKKCFDYVGLDHVNHIDMDSELYRSVDTAILKADTKKIKSELNWTPRHSIDDTVKIMMDYQLRLITNKN